MPGALLSNAVVELDVVGTFFLQGRWSSMVESGGDWLFFFDVPKPAVVGLGGSEWWSDLVSFCGLRILCV